MMAVIVKLAAMGDVTGVDMIPDVGVDGFASGRDIADDNAEFAGVLKCLDARRTFQN